MLPQSEPVRLAITHCELQAAYFRLCAAGGGAVQPGTSGLLHTHSPAPRHDRLGHQARMSTPAHAELCHRWQRCTVWCQHPTPRSQGSRKASQAWSLRQGRSACCRSSTTAPLPTPACWPRMGTLARASHPCKQASDILRACTWTAQMLRCSESSACWPSLTTALPPRQAYLPSIGTLAHASCPFSKPAQACASAGGQLICQCCLPVDLYAVRAAFVLQQLCGLPASTCSPLAQHAHAAHKCLSAGPRLAQKSQAPALRAAFRDPSARALARAQDATLPS